MKLLKDSEYEFHYSTDLVYYQCFILTVTKEHHRSMPKVICVESTSGSDLKDILGDKLKPKIVYSKELTDTLLYISCYHPHEITAPSFYKWLYEATMMYHEQSHKLLEVFMRNKYERMVKDRQLYHTTLARHWARINLYKDIMNYASVQFTESA